MDVKSKSKNWQEIRAEFRELCRAAFDALSRQSVVDVGFLPRAYLEDFVAGVFFMIDTLAAASDDQIYAIQSGESEVLPELKPTARRLCQLSRDVLFALDTSRLPDILTQSIERLFVRAAELIPESPDTELDDYRVHIGGRRLQAQPTSASANALTKEC